MVSTVNDSGEKAKWSTQVPNTAKADRGNIRRSWDPFQHPELGVKGCRTLYEGLRFGRSINPLGPCLGFRAVSTNGLATPYIYSTYTECVARIDAFAAGLDRLQLVERNPNDGMLVLGLYMKNCMEWVLAEYAVYALGGATCPLYDTLGPDTVSFILAQTATTAVVCTRAELSRVCEAKQSGDCPRLKHIILVDGVTAASLELANPCQLNLVSFAKVEAMGAQLIATTGHKHSPPSPQDVATFCYTSGTTGVPKGALITHENFISTIAGLHHASNMRIEAFDRHLSYLPLPHIYERVVLSQVLLAGASAAFYRGNPLWLIEDLQACRPTILPVAPRVLNRIYDKIMAGISAAGGVKKRLFDSALQAKARGLQQCHLKHALYDRLIFNKIKAGLGMDHLRFMVSGSAPLSKNVMTFFRCILGVVLVEGYGQTEGTAAATLGHPDDVSTVGHVGGPTGTTEIVLVDVPEMGYLHTDTDHHGQPCYGRGEIWVRGPNVFKGYYQDEEKTKEILDEDGWLHSGDIGLWTVDGALQIIDRKKNIFKLSQGEYVAPEKIENIVNHCPLIAQCFVHGDSLQSYLVAVVVPDEEPVRTWAAQHANGDNSDPSLATASMEQLCQDSQLHQAILQQIQEVSKEAKLQGFETVRAIFVETNPFTVENDLVTPTFKLRREKLRDYYARQIEAMYASHIKSKL